MIVKALQALKFRTASQALGLGRSIILHIIMTKSMGKMMSSISAII